ncbi:M15 family metallopeptidase [Psychrilyobacter atlanticus]|uniref:M15 family metallopeptidase n=1 Tax=Psychrilyobacter atlanticus TaxID=271091 RepID=UPI00042404FB|nr:M15 family metallopeptidase [Psychrilyobacter atlanticus]
MNKISNRSIKNIQEIDPRLPLIVGMVLARGKVDLTITCGLRSLEDQQKAFKNGFSKLDGVNKKSKHQIGKAIDFIPYPFNGWNDIESFKKVGEELKVCADYLGIKNSYGGDWKTFKDYPHFQLD